MTEFQLLRAHVKWQYQQYRVSLLSLLLIHSLLICALLIGSFDTVFSFTMTNLQVSVHAISPILFLIFSLIWLLFLTNRITNSHATQVYFNHVMTPILLLKVNIIIIMVFAIISILFAIFSMYIVTALLYFVAGYPLFLYPFTLAHNIALPLILFITLPTIIYIKQLLPKKYRLLFLMLSIMCGYLCFTYISSLFWLSSIVVIASIFLMYILFTLSQRLEVT